VRVHHFRGDCGSGVSYRIIGAIIMLGGVALQSTSRSAEVFVAARTLRELLHPVTFVPESLMPLFTVGVGLTFSLTASPLLITELAYPTQVRELLLPV
jgi:hypothetical protein